MNSPNVTNNLADDEVIGFVGDITDYWSYTQVRDWVLLMPGITRTALHLYLLLRSMVSEAARRSGGGLRRMSYDQLCYLLPGTSEDKPASATMIKDALKVLDALNLVSNPDGGRLVTSVGKGGIQNNFRKYQVHDLPLDAYTGWRNVWDKLDAYTVDWRENPPQPPTHVRTGDGVQRIPAGRPHPEPAPAAKEQPKAKPAPKKTAPKPPVKKAAPKPAPQGTLPEDPASDPVADSVVEAWAAGMRSSGHPFLPKRAQAIAVEAAQLLAAGADADHLRRVARWMGQVKPSWKVLEDAMTWPDAPKPGIPAQQGSSRQAAIDACSRCDEYGQVDVDGRIAKCRHEALPAPAPAPVAEPAPEQEPVVPERRLRDLIGALAQANA
ncbi:hypothetical protein GCM10010363_60240 [Streptomyces omiyaensis]|uniref:hypothetical protein n=1 Tax=Streptomyces omiyaensis TaxID=68247 RepID=UPI001671D56C|nr:hypothetical protein [Streptomyces omiyaensis]GGY71064.1 hypothetical protein GCM10010363_60240 [Streptomyces omiyaensis]